MRTARAAHTAVIPDWRPATMNQLLRSVRTRVRLKHSDREWVGAYLVCRHRVPRAAGPRRVWMTLRYPPGETYGDGDGSWKSVLDALVWYGLLVSDAPAWCELTPVAYDRGPAATALTLEDLGAEPLSDAELRVRAHPAHVSVPPEDRIHA